MLTRRALKRLRGLAKPVLLVAAVFGLLLGLLMLFETKLIFFPAKYPDGQWAFMERVGAEDVWLTTGDNVRIHAAWLQSGEPGPAVLFFHGNAGNLSGRLPFMAAIQEELGCSVLIVDYRGYGKSDGSPSEQGLYSDADAALAWLSNKGFAPERVLVWGNSLGGGVATELATRHDVGALVLSSTFTSIPDMAKRSFPFIPSGLVRTQFDNLGKVGRISAAIVIVHSRQDALIPYQMAEQLTEVASPGTQLVLLDGPDHNEVFHMRRTQVLDAVRPLAQRLR